MDSESQDRSAFMTTLLFIQSSPRGAESSSNQAGASLVEALRARHPGMEVTTRDVAGNPPPHVDAAFVAANFALPEQRTGEQVRALEASEACIDEILAADIIVIAAPMFNFSIPSSLKAWIDNIVRVGRTLRFSPDGPVGALEGKRFILVISSGGVYSSGYLQDRDFTEPYLRAVLGLVGVKDIDTVRVEGSSVSAIGPEKAMAAARARIAELVPQIA